MREIELEIYELEKWFTLEYPALRDKYMRRRELGIANTDGTDPNIKLIELYRQAESNAALIRELKNSFQG